MFLVSRTILLLTFCMYPELDSLDANMLVFWGQPTSSTKHCVVRTEATSFDDCISLCLTSTYCMIAYGDASDCTLCDIYAIDTVTQTDSSGGVKIAVKIDVLDTCPTDLQGNQYARTNDFNNYSISYSEPTWTITYEKNCVDLTWRMFPRPAGATCLFVGAVVDSDISHTNATLKCRALGPRIDLGGMQNQVEYDYVMGEARTLLGSDSIRDYTPVWISGRMKWKCSVPAPASDCIGINAFELFPYQNNFDVYMFPPGYPNFTALGTINPPNRTNYQECLWLRLGQKKMDWNGMVSNAVCSLNCNGGTTTCGGGYVCGGLAR